MQVATPKKGYKFVKTSFGKYEEIPEEWEVEMISKLTSKIENGYAYKENNSVTFWIVVVSHSSGIASYLPNDVFTNLYPFFGVATCIRLHLES